MAGHVRQRGKNWELRVYTGRDPLTNTKQYATRTVPASGPREAEKALARFITELEDAGTVTAAGSFGELLEQWYRVRAQALTPAGQKEARRIIQTKLAPLAAVQLDSLAGPGGTRMLDNYYAALRDRGGECRKKTDKCPTKPCPHGGGDPLSAATVHRVHNVIHAALEQAVTWEVIRRNPATKTTPGDIEDPDHRPPESVDVLRLFQEVVAAGDHELAVFLILGAVTGARKSELLALRWDDIDFERSVISFGHVISVGFDGPERIRKGRGRGNRKGKERVVPIAEQVAMILQMQFKRCAENCAAAGVVLPAGAPSYVFAAVNERGATPARDEYGFDPWRPDSTTRRFRVFRDRVGLTGMRVHDLRGFVISELLSAGVDLRTVQELVGHAPGSPVTLKVYAKSRQPNKIAAAGVMAALLELGG